MQDAEAAYAGGLLPTGSAALAVQHIAAGDGRREIREDAAGLGGMQIGFRSGEGQLLMRMGLSAQSMHDTPRWFFSIGFGMDVMFSKMWNGPGCP